jgi:hypothetical protein
MRFSTRAFIGAMALAAMSGVAAQANAAYFVRPYVQQGFNAPIDGYQANGATSGSVNFATQFQSQVDLNDGTIRTNLEVTGPSVGGSGFGQSAGIFGDQITFNGALGEQVDLSFDFDGHITAPEWDAALNSLMQIGINASIWVYEAGAGATYTNFTSLGGAVASDSVALTFNNPEFGLDEFVFESLATAFTINTDGPAAYDVFVSFSSFVSMNNNPGTVTLDFMDTGTLGIATAPGVVFTSESGALLGSEKTAGAIPEPGTWALMIGGFGLAGVALRRRRVVALA